MFLNVFITLNTLAIFGYFLFNFYFILYSKRENFDMFVGTDSNAYPVQIILVIVSYIISYLYLYFTSGYGYIVLNITLSIFYKMWYFYLFSILYIFFSVTLISIIFTAIFYKNEMFIFLNAIFIIFVGGHVMLLANNFFIFFIGYEFLLLPSFVILYKYAKTYRCVEAAYVMFFWTQFGSFFIMLVLFLFVANYRISTFSDLNTIIINNSDLKMIIIFLLIGFGVKMPIWPFYSWLPKAHVEASTNFSIFLSGVLVKLAFLGFLKFLLYINTDIYGWYLYLWMLLGILEVSQKLFYQTDLKKIIALTTVIEMHWLVFTVLHTTSLLYYSAVLMFISHALISSLFFILADCISRRFKTRNIYEITGLWLKAPVLSAFILITNVIFLGFPYTSLFLSEFLFFLAILDINPMLFFFFVFILYFCNPIIIFRAWVMVLYGKSWIQTDHKDEKNYYDLTLTESLIIFFFISHLIVLGVCPIINLM